MRYLYYIDMMSNLLPYQPHYFKFRYDKYTVEEWLIYPKENTYKFRCHGHSIRIDMSECRFVNNLNLLNELL